MRTLGLLAVLALALAGCNGGSDRLGGGDITGCIDPVQSSTGDIRRHLPQIRSAKLCYRRQRVREHGHHWLFHILEHRDRPDGPFWVLPHDNEDTAFDVALEAVLRYGGGLLAVDSDGRRRFRGQDPNRNFSSSRAEARLCGARQRPAPRYTRAILSHYRGRGPYLALHNNFDGWYGNGGRGNISIHLAGADLYSFYGTGGSAALRDEDNLIFMAGLRPPAADPSRRRRIAALNGAGLHVIYKQVTDRNFDCSLSDYVARHRLGDYYNLEAEYGRTRAQREMVAGLMGVLGIEPLRRRRASPFLE